MSSPEPGIELPQDLVDAEIGPWLAPPDAYVRTPTRKTCADSWPHGRHIWFTPEDYMPFHCEGRPEQENHAP